MRASFFLLMLAALPLAGQTGCPIDEDLTRGKTSAARPHDPGEFTPEGWKVSTLNTQLKFDLGRHYRKGRVEIEIKGPLQQKPKHSLFSAGNEEAAADGDRKTQGFFQLRLINDGMMLRLTYRPGGRSFEQAVAPLEWKDQWYRIEGTWDTTGSDSTLVRDGVLLKTGRFNSPFEGFRWVFVGKDNYQRFASVPGMIYRKLKVCVSDPAAPSDR